MRFLRMTDLSDKQHSEMLKVVRAVNRDSRAINDLCTQEDKVIGSDNNLLRAAWQQDVVERLDYEKDQSMSGMHVYRMIRKMLADGTVINNICTIVFHSEWQSW